MLIVIFIINIINIYENFFFFTMNDESLKGEQMNSKTLCYSLQMYIE